jgi:hypothetical protein
MARSRRLFCLRAIDCTCSCLAGGTRTMKPSDLGKYKMSVPAIDEVDFGPRSPIAKTERGASFLASNKKLGLRSNVARVADGLFVLWVVVGGVFFFRQFWDTAIPYLARLF